MLFIENVILNLILILFPILLYFVFCCYITIKDKEFNNYILCLLLFSSCYLFLKYGGSINNNMMLLFSNIPIILAYIKRIGVIGIVLSLFIVIYSYLNYDYNVMVMSIKFLVYYFIYILVYKKDIGNNYLIIIMAIVQGFFLSFEYFFIEDISVHKLLEVFSISFLFYIISFLILYFFNFIDKITSLFYQIKELEKEKQIKDSLFKLTHEVKNPLAVCKGYLDMINFDDNLNLRRYIGIIKQEINRSLNIMNDFLEFNKIKINKELIDINVLLDDVYDTFKIINNKKNIKLLYKEKDDEVYIDGDYDRLKQVFLNLIKNSVEAIEDIGTIDMGYYINNGQCIIFIKDNGCGMDSETLKNIKTMFYTTKKYGSGIGVCLSNEIIKAHDGKLIYDSVYKEGTCVKIELSCSFFC